MNIVDWYNKRGMRFILKRGKILTERYNLNPDKAMARIRNCVEKFSEYGCHPTFFVPGIVVRRNSEFIRELQDRGCEIGVHSYHHIDMRSITPQEANQQLNRAVEVFREEDLQIDGFRCPYLSISDEIIQELKPGLFNYSSNRAIAWVNPGSNNHHKNLLFDIIEGFYTPALAQNSLSLPYHQENVLEIPVNVPDDLQMLDGMGYTQDEIPSFLLKTFKQIHQRGELFNLLFHPELVSLLIEPFMRVLSEVNASTGKVWVARLRDISAWWKEKDDFKIHIEKENGKHHLVIDPPERATILLRGLNNHLLSEDWDERYRRSSENPINITSDRLPLIGISSDLPAWVHTSLERMGYILVNLAEWENCTIKITCDFIDGCTNPVELIAAIEDIEAPLIRFWPWPDGYRSALCLSGDLDALSLMDYATRLLPM